MSNYSLNIPTDVFQRLRSNPHQTVDSRVNGIACRISLSIPNYRQNIVEHFGLGNEHALQTIYTATGFPLPFKHFGLDLHFEEAAQVHVHDHEFQLEPLYKQLIDQFGAVVIHNAYLDSNVRDMGHRNRFPHLSFHVDRGPLQPTPYSVFTRNPFDAEQAAPRLSSTLYICQMAGYLQCKKENQKILENQLISQCVLFEEEAVNELIGHIILEQPWALPTGTGEISLLDNRSTLHASYYRHPSEKGYRIGVRYVS